MPTGLAAYRRILAGGVSHVFDLAVGAQDASIRGDFFHFGLAEAEMSDRPGLPDRGSDGRGRPRDHVPLEAGVRDLTVDAIFRQQDIDREIADRGVVLVERVDHNPPGVGTGRRGERTPELHLAVVGDADPVDRAEDDRPTVAQKDDTPTRERVSDPLGRVVHERATHGGRRIDRKDTDLERLGSCGHTDGHGQNQGDRRE